MIISSEQLEEENERLKNEMENRSWSSMYQSNQSLGNQIDQKITHSGLGYSSTLNNDDTKNTIDMKKKDSEPIKNNEEDGGSGKIQMLKLSNSNHDAKKIFDKKMFESSRELKEELTMSYLNYIQSQNEELKNTLINQENI